MTGPKDYSTNQVTSVDLSDEHYHRALFENMLTGIVVLEVIYDTSGKPVDHRLLQANAQFEVQTGLKREQEVGKTSADLSFKWPDDVRQKYYSIAEHGGSVNWERYNGSLGTYYDTRVFSPKKGQFAVMFYDISERKNAEKLLQESKLQYDRLAANIPVGVYLLSTRPPDQFAFIYVSPRFCKLINVQEEEVYRNPRMGYSFIHPDDREDFARLNQMAVETNRPFVWEGRTLIDGRVAWLRIESNPEPQQDGGCLWDGLATDITESKQAEDRFRQAFEAAPNAMIMANTDGRIVLTNQRTCTLFGFSKDELVGRNINVLLPSSGRAVHAMNSEALHGQPEEQQTAQGRELPGRHKDGRNIPVEVGFNPLQTGEGMFVIASVVDITDRKKSEALIWNQANYDQLTRLPNRRLFSDRLEQEIRKAQRELHSTALLFIDLDRFKEVNDTLGHDAGDVLLIEAAERIRSCVRSYDTVARLGGDEFTVILAELTATSDIGRIAQNIIDSLSRSFQIRREDHFVSASIGIALYPQDATTAIDLLKNADQAMYEAKVGGRGRFHFFTKAMQEASENRIFLANDLRRALTRGQLDIHYQPIIDLRDGTITKAEALLRWNHPERGMIGPAIFIPIAEATGTIQEIGDWVFEQGAAQAAKLSAGLGRDFQISINQSPVQINNDGRLHERWMEKLKTLGLPGRNIVVEITEGLLMNDSLAVAETLLRFRDAGIQISIDDFGTGYSALSYLRKFDVDFLKIDRSFTANLALGAEDFALCEAIVTMAHKLGIKVIAEGVETQQQRDLLQQMGCDFGQGYLFSKPLPVEQFEAFLANA